MKIGERLGKLTYLRQMGVYGVFLCDCGKEHKARINNVKQGNCRSCGCLRKERAIEQAVKNTAHGHAKRYGGRTGTYNTWWSMVTRCTNNAHPSYKWYGAKGITLCEEWRVFEKFLADMGERPEGLELDRIDNSLGYYKANCRWISHKENCNNKGGSGYGTKPC